jgi:hypothetical protein
MTVVLILHSFEMRSLDKAGVGMGAERNLATGGLSKEHEQPKATPNRGSWLNALST